MFSCDECSPAFEKVFELILKLNGCGTGRIDIFLAKGSCLMRMGRAITLAS